MTTGLTLCNTYGILSRRSSSCYGNGHLLEYSSLDYKIGGGGGTTAWCAADNNVNQWVSLASPVPMLFTAVSTQGRGDGDQWVLTYKVKYSLDGVNFIDEGTYTGNNNRTTIVTNKLAKPILARIILICPLTWNNHISMRFDAHCEPIKSQSSHVECGSGACPTNTPLQSGNGARNYTLPIKFKTPFAGVPDVICALNYTDTSKDVNQRLIVEAQNITKDGFDMVFSSYADSITYYAAAKFTAVLSV